MAAAALPWAPQVLLGADLGPMVHALLAIEALVALIGTCQAAGTAIAFKPAARPTFDAMVPRLREALKALREGEAAADGAAATGAAKKGKGKARK